MGNERKQAYRGWMANTFDTREAIVFTLNFRQRSIADGKQEWLTEQIAADTVRRFYRGLSRMVYGSRAASREKTDARLKFAAVKEGTARRQDRTGTQLHYHGAIEVPEGMQPDTWMSICEQSWLNLRWADKHSNDFQSYRSSGFIAYMLKNRSKTDWEAAVGVDTLWLDPVDERKLRAELHFSSV